MNTMATAKRQLLMLRAELSISQEELAREARLSQAVISKIEMKQSVRAKTLYQVFYAINRLRKERGFPELAFDEIEWT